MQRNTQFQQKLDQIKRHCLDNCVDKRVRTAVTTADGVTSVTMDGPPSDVPAIISYTNQDGQHVADIYIDAERNYYLDAKTPDIKMYFPFSVSAKSLYVNDENLNLSLRGDLYFKDELNTNTKNITLELDSFLDAKRATILTKENAEITGEVNFKDYFYANAQDCLTQSGKISQDAAYTAQQDKNDPKKAIGSVELHAKNTVIKGEIDSYSTIISGNEHVQATKGAKLNSQSRTIFSGSDFKSKANIKCDGYTEFDFAGKVDLEDAWIESDICEVKADAISARDASIVGHKKLNLNGKKEIYADASTRIYSPHLTFNTTLARIEHASISGDEVEINADNYYQKRGVMDAKELVFNGKKYFNDTYIFADNFELNATEKMEMGEKAEVHCGSDLRYTAKEFINRGKHVAEHSLDINVKDTLTNFSTGKFELRVPKEAKKTESLPPFMRIQAGKLYNIGEITANIDYLLSLNRLFANGFTEWSSPLEMAKGCKSAKIGGKNVYVVAPITMSIGNCYRNKGEANISSFLNVNVGLNSAWNVNVNSLLNIDCGAFIPNPAKLVTYLKAVANGDFNAIADAIFTDENAYTAIGLLITALKIMVPLAGAGLGIAWNLILLGKQLPQIISMCKSLYEKGGENIELRDVIPLIVMCKSAALQVVSTASMGINFSRNFVGADGGLQAPKFETHFDASSLLKAAATVAVTVAPGNRTDALVNLSLPGVKLTGMSQSNTLYNYASPFSNEVAAVVNHNFYAAQLRGNIAAGTLTLEGQHLGLGHTIADQAYVNVKDLKILDQVDFNYGYVSAEEFEQRQKLRMGGGQIDVKHDAKFSKDLDLKDTVVKAGNDIVVTPDAKLKVDNVNMQAGHDMQYAGKADVTNTFVAEAKNNLDTTVSSSMSGSGVAVLKSQGGTPGGAVTTAGAVVENNSLSNADAMNLLTGEGLFEQMQPTAFLSYKTDKPVDIDREVKRDTGVLVSAAKVDVNANVTSENVVALESTQGKVTNNNKKVEGRETYVNSKDDIDNNGGIFKGTKFLQAYAEGDINNNCLVQAVQGPYDIVEQYTPAAFLGGTDGGVVYAKGKIYNDASVITADGPNYVFGEHGVESTPRTHTHITYKKTEHYGLFNSKKKTITNWGTQVQAPVIASKNDRNSIYSENGQVDLVATDTLSRYGTDIYARGLDENGNKKNVNILDIVTSNGHEEQKSSFGGLIKSDKKYRGQESIPTVVANYDPGLTRIHTLEGGEVNMRSVVVNAPGTTEISGKDGTNITLNVLQHQLDQSRRGFSISAFGIPIIGGTNTPLFSSDPTVDHLQRLGNSKYPEEFALNSLSASIDMANTINTFKQASAQGNLFQALSERYLGDALENPKFTFGFHTSKSRARWQTPGPGGIFTNVLDTRGSDGTTVLGVPVIADTIKVDSELEQRGTTLHSSYSHHDTSVYFSFGPQSMFRPDVTVTQSRGTQTATTHIPQVLKVNNMEIKSRKWVLNDAQADIGSVSGEVDKIQVISHPDTYDQREEMASAGTDGNVAYQYTHNKGSSLPQASGIHARNDLTDEQLRVNELEMTGGKITSDGKLDLNPKKVKIYDVNTGKSSKQSGFAFNTNDIKGIFAGKPDNADHSHYENLLNPESQMNANKISTVQFNNNVATVQQVQHSVINGAQGTHVGGEVQGNLHTSSADGRGPIERHSRQLIAEIPLPTEANAKLANKALESFKTLSPTRALRDKLATMNIPVLNSKNELQRMAALSNLVYKDDYGQNEALDQGVEIYTKPYVDPETGTRIVIYRNDENAYIVFRGTDGWQAISTDDWDLLRGKAPRSTENTEFATYLSVQIQKLQQSGFNIYLTGFSRGAAQASVVSSATQLPAVVFDNTGLPKGSFEMKNVVSIQSPPNIINSYPKASGDFDYGAVWQLPETPTDTLVNLSLQAASSIPLFAPAALAGQTRNSHNMGRTEERLQQILK